MSLFKSASVVSAFTLLSRITGYAREVLFAIFFGANALTDAFNVAFRMPNLLRRLFAEGAFSQAFVPTLAATRAESGDARTRELLAHVATVLFWVLFLVSAAGVLAAPWLVWALASGLPADGEQAAIAMTRWMMPYIGLISFVSLASGVLNTWGKFAVSAFTPTLLNICLIATMWLGVPQMQALGYPGIYAQALGVMLGGIAQLLLQLWALKKINMLPRIGLTWQAIKTSWQHEDTQRILRLMLPAVLGVSVAQISLLINTQIASYLPPGSVSWLSYSDRLMEFPTALLGVALGVVLMPQLAAARGAHDAARYSSMIDWGLRLVLLFALPFAVALLVFSRPLVETLFHYGRFSAHDASQVTRSLMGYGLGLLGLVAIKVLAPAYFAKGDMKTPVKIAVVVLIFTQILNYLLVPHLQHAALTLSISLGALLNAAWLLTGLIRKGSYSPQPGWGKAIAQIVLATAVLGAGLWGVQQYIDWGSLHAIWRVTYLLATIAVLGLAYFATLALLGFPVRQMMRR